MRSKEGDKEGAGAGESSLDVPPICAHELRKRPALLPTLGVWSAVVRTSHELIELREAVRRAKPRLAWVPWLSLLPRLATNAPASDDSGNGGNGGNVGGRPGSASAPPPPPPPTRKLVPGAERLRQSEEALATAKVFLAAVAKDGAAVVRTKGSEAAARCVLQLLEAERHALMLVLLRQRPPHLPLPTATRGRRRVGRAARREKPACERHTHTRSGRCVPQTRACNGRGAAAVHAAARRRRRRRAWRRRWARRRGGAPSCARGARGGATLERPRRERRADRAGAIRSGWAVHCWGGRCPR